MKVNSRSPFFILALLPVLMLSLGGILFSVFAGEEETGKTAEKAKELAGKENLPATVEEARGRARWLHEGFRGALLVMHRDFFEENDPGALPSQSLDDVFDEMARSWSVEINWLGINATKGVDHYPNDRFEEAAAAALESGKTEYEVVENGQYRYVGVIPMQNQCLKCHVRNRTSLEDRLAGLSISFPLKVD
ncbi:MAG: hypothetical protein KA152_17345 [Verrucomicrobiales bacterium]|jgi:hypothetical protein|nr:hypothetical protein [Verrucomicrobiales bacterium]